MTTDYSGHENHIFPEAPVVVDLEVGATRDATESAREEWDRPSVTRASRPPLGRWRAAGVSPTWHHCEETLGGPGSAAAGLPTLRRAAQACPRSHLRVCCAHGVDLIGGRHPTLLCSDLYPHCPKTGKSIVLAPARSHGGRGTAPTGSCSVPGSLLACGGAHPGERGPAVCSSPQLHAAAEMAACGCDAVPPVCVVAGIAGE